MSKIISVAEKYPQLLESWDYDKNKEDPKDIPCCTNHKYYWKCKLNHTIFANPKIKAGYVNDCPYCSGRKVLKGFNDLWTTHPDIANMLVNPEDGYNVTYGSRKKLDWNCPLCGSLIKSKEVNDIRTRNKISCKYCGDGVSYPEKVFISLFDYLNLNYIHQLTKTYDGFDWCDKYRYDFYLEDYSLIIEVNGGFHYGKEYKHKNALPKEQVIINDKLKEKLALHNNIENYISIDCRQSHFNYIKNSILNSKLKEIIDLKNIDWTKIEENIIGSYVVEVCEYYNRNPEMTITNIAKHFSKDKGTITNYLINGTKIGLCKYDMSNHKKLACKHYHYKQPVICINTNKLFNSIKEAGTFYNIASPSNISSCCTGKLKTCGKLSNGTKLKWKYV